MYQNESPDAPTAPTQPPSGDPLLLIANMQQQHMAMQQQMAALISQLTPSATNSPNRTGRAKLERPTIEADCTDNRWIIFRDAWSRYKEMASLTSATEIRNELRSTCSPKINEMLFNFVGPDTLNTCSEEDLMDFIKSVAVKTIHPEVYRQQFFTLRQTDCESITNFISRLKAQAMLCAFTTKGSCNQNTCMASFAEDMVKSQLIAGLRNASHQSKILSEMEVLKTLEQVTTRLLALESTERATTHFRPPSEIAPISDRDAYRRENKRPDPSKSKKCSGCGQALHPKGRSSCPAWGKNCRKCGKPNHFVSVCRSPSSTSTNGVTIDDEPTSLLSSIRAEQL